MTVKRMDNVGIVVEDLDAAIEFFTELGLTLEGRMPIEGEWAGRVTGLHGQRVEVAMLRTPDGHGGIELARFLTPPSVADHRNAPVNALGYLRVMFAVDHLDTRFTSVRIPKSVSGDGKHRLTLPRRRCVEALLVVPQLTWRQQSPHFLRP